MYNQPPARANLPFCICSTFVIIPALACLSSLSLPKHLVFWLPRISITAGDAFILTVVKERGFSDASVQAF